MAYEVETKVYKTDDGHELTSFYLVEKPSVWQRIKDFFKNHDVKPYVKCRDFNNSESNNGNKPKPAVEGGIKLTF